MLTVKRLAGAAFALLVAGCVGDVTSPVTPESARPTASIRDAGHGGAPGFHFLPPMMKPAAFTGTFDGGLQPTVQVCELVGAVCGQVVATFPFGTGGNATRVSVADQHYVATWHARAVDPAKFYRIRVLVGEVELGYADVDVVATGKEEKAVDGTQYVAVKAGSTLPIKFRIETGIVGSIDVSPDSAAIEPGQTQAFVATTMDLHGNPVAASVTWSSSAPGVATVDASGTATGVGPGSSTITASTAWGSASATLVVEVVNTAPVANADSFEGIGNVSVPVAAPGVLANDADAEGNALSVVPGTYPTAAGGTVQLAADGGFGYRGPAGFTGSDSFSYDVTDGQATATGTATVASPTRVWYVSNAGVAPGDGRDASPFTELKAVEAPSAAGETIFLLSGNNTTAGYDQGIVLKAGQALTGQGIPADVTAELNGQTVVLLQAGTAPMVARITAGPAVDLATNNTVQGVNVTSSAGAGIVGSAFGTFAAAHVSVTANGGPALDLQGGNAAATFRSLSSSASTGAGLRLLSVSGSVQVTGDGSAAGSGGTIQGSAGDGVSVTSSGSVHLSRVRVVDAAGRGVASAGTAGLVLDATLVSGSGSHGVWVSGAGAVSLLNGSRVENAGDANDEFGIFLDGATGSVTVDGSSVFDATDDLVRVAGSAGSVSLVVRNGSVLEYAGGRSTADFAGAGIMAIPNGGAAVTVDVRNSTFRNIVTSSVQLGAAAAGSSGASTLTFVSNQVGSMVPGKGGAVQVLGRFATSTTVTATDNVFADVGGTGVVLTDAKQSSQIRGTIARNTITDAGSAGIVVYVDGGGASRVAVDANDIRRAGSDGIQAANFGGPGAPSLDVVVTGNRVDGHNLSPSAAFLGGIVVFGFEDATCLALTGNTVVNSPAGYEHVYLEHGAGTFQYEEVPNTAATGVVTPAFVQSQNAVASAAVNGAVLLSDGASCARP